MARNYFEDRLNDLYTSVQDGDLESFYDLEYYLTEKGYRKGFLGLDDEGLLDDPDEVCL